MDSQEKWLEISLLVDGELAEAVAEVLSRFIPSGVVIEQFVPSERMIGKQQPSGPLRVAGYLPVNEHVDQLRQQITEALWYLGRIKDIPEPEFKSVQQTDWSAAWKKNYHPIPIGRKLLVAPSWVEPDPQGRVVIRIDPGMAFGTGTHPTTKLSLEFIETEVAVHQPIIDIGCGSGILAIAAIRLGASQAIGADPDPDAVAAAQTNARINGVAREFTIIQGSAEEVLTRQGGARVAPLVVANILAPVLVSLLGTGLAELVAPNGSLILSGILTDQAQLIVEEVLQYDLQVVGRKEEGDWVALHFRKP